MSKFVAVDGEGITRNGVHFYTLLASSLPDDPGIENYDKGLHSVRCLDYLLSLRGKGTLVSFSFYYDTTMCLVSLPLAKAHELSQRGSVFVDGGPKKTTYRIEYLKRKILSISLGYVDRGTRKWTVCRDKHGVAYWVKIYDVFGFFQCSFVRALVEWGIASRIELEAMEAMKADRANFALKHPDEIRAYNKEECVRLVQLMDLLAGKLEQLGIALSSWHGAGAVANAVLKKQKADRYLPKSEHWSIIHSYFGGRIQTLQLGLFEGLYTYDVRSAYPYAMAQLPLFDTNLHPARVFDGIGPYDLVELKWNCPDRITAFPFRLQDQSVQYPSSGHGVYHAAEVLAADPKHYEVLKVFRLEYDDTVKPFEWIEDYYAHRALLRAMGDSAQLAVKLVLNSLYGKTAQRVGYKGRIPRYRSYIVAGAITAKTRSMLYAAARDYPEHMVMFATDGIASLTQLPLTLGDELGDWEESEWETLEVYQPGFYRFNSKGRKPLIKTRSMHPDCVDWTYCANEWLKNDVNGHFDKWLDKETGTLTDTVIDFVTLGLSSVNNRPGQWVKKPKCISLWPTKGRPVSVGPPGAHRSRQALFPCAGPSHFSAPFVAIDPDLGYNDDAGPEF